MKTAIAYIRVSTQKQGRSGLGLEAQIDTIARYAEANGYTVAQTFTEIETGKGSNALERRPQLAAAMKTARKAKGYILVAKLDRLSRDVHFISGLMVHKVRFKAADLPPDADPFMLHVYAAVAQRERQFISDRTKEGLAAARRRGVKLGDRSLGKRNKAAARARARALRPILRELAHLSHRAAARKLNEQGVETPTGAPWSYKTVQRVRERLA
jgi:DNA invertase Pin-like site-specific DNA recombinase